MTKVKKYDTVFPAISIPWNDDGTVNEKELRAYVNWLADFEGMDGLVVNGHTGEITSIPQDMRVKLTSIVADEVGDRMTIVSGVSSDCTEVAIEEAKRQKEAGADGIMLMPPHIWLRFSMKQQSAFEFYQDVANGADIDIVVHLYPATSLAHIETETLVKMGKEIPQIKAIKQGTRIPPKYERDVRTLRKEIPHVKLLTCYDEAYVSSLLPGMDGTILGFAGCVPELILGAFKAYQDRDLTTLLEYTDRIHPMSLAVYGVGQPTGEAHARLKQAMVERGIFTSALMKKPVLPLSEEELEFVRKGVKDSGVSKVNLV